MTTTEHPTPTGAPPTPAASTGPVIGPVTAARITQLAASHRGTQAAHRDALATENPAGAGAARTRLDRITGALRDAGAPGLADALSAEASTGAVLLTLLTADDDTSGTQLGDGLADYQRCRHTVDTLLTDGAHSDGGTHPGGAAAGGPLLVEKDRSLRPIAPAH